MNEEKNPDAEIVASGVLVGFFIYTSVVLISFCFGNTDHKRSPVVSYISFLDINHALKYNEILKTTSFNFNLIEIY